MFYISKEEVEWNASKGRRYYYCKCGIEWVFDYSLFALDRFSSSSTPSPAYIKYLYAIYPILSSPAVLLASHIPSHPIAIAHEKTEQSLPFLPLLLYNNNMAF